MHSYSSSLAKTLGSATGETEHATVAGGWAGTDDDTSTAPSDRLGIPPNTEEIPVDKKLRIIETQAETEDHEGWDKQVESDEIEELKELKEKAPPKGSQEERLYRHNH